MACNFRCIKNLNNNLHLLINCATTLHSTSWTWCVQSWFCKLSKIDMFFLCWIKITTAGISTCTHSRVSYIRSPGSWVVSTRELVEYYTTQHIIQQMRGPSKFYTFLVSIESPNWIGQPSMNVTGNRETFKRKLHCGNHAIVLLNLTLPAWA